MNDLFKGFAVLPERRAIILMGFASPKKSLSKIRPRLPIGELCGV